MKRLQRVSLSTKITGIVILVLTSVCMGLGLMTFKITKDRFQASAIMSLENQAAMRKVKIERQIDLFFSYAKGVTHPSFETLIFLLFLAKDENEKAKIVREIEEKLQKNNSRYSNLIYTGIFDEDENLIAQTPVFEQGEQVTTSNFSKRTTQPFISLPFFFKDRLVVDVSIPLYSHSRKNLAVLLLRMQAREFIAITGDYTGLGKTGETILGVRNNNEIQYLTPSRFDMRGRSTLWEGKDNPMYHAIYGQTGIFYTRDYRDAPVVAVYTPISSANWGLVIKQDEEEAFREVNEIALILIISFFVLLILAPLVVYQLVRFFTRHLRDLEQATNQVASGDLTATVRVPQEGEVGSLACSFNIMVDRLREVRRELQKSNRDLSAMLNATFDYAMLLNTDGRIVAMNKPAAKELQKEIDPLAEKDKDIYVPGNILERLKQIVKEITETSQPFRFIDDSGHKTIDYSVFPVFNQDQKIVRLAIFAKNITEQKVAEEKIKTLSLAVEQSPVSVMITNPQGSIEYINPQFTKVHGYHLDDALHKSPENFKARNFSSQVYQDLWKTVSEGKQWHGELCTQSMSEELIWQLVSVSPITDDNGKITHYVFVQEDITEKKEQEEQMKHIALHDALTGLPNRLLLKEHLALAIAQSERTNTNVAILFIDLDGFKDINDQHGHNCGDLVLQTIADRLKLCIRKGDTAARYGGDEFVVILQNILHFQEIETMIERIFDRLNESIFLAGSKCEMGVSVGISIFPDDSKDGDLLINFADRAMYSVKNSGKNNFKFYKTTDSIIKS